MENDSQKQIEQISDKIRRRVDAIICFSVNYKEIARGVQECNLANISFIALNRIAWGNVDGVAKSDDYKVGNDLGLYFSPQI